jgi:hypothetical protein
MIPTVLLPDLSDALIAAPSTPVANPETIGNPSADRRGTNSSINRIAPAVGFLVPTTATEFLSPSENCPRANRIGG